MGALGPQLVELRVQNLGVIDDVTVALGPGMTALTGETGAGKTLLVEALSLLLGARADPSVVRAGTDEAVVEGRFVVPPGHRPFGSAPDPDPGDDQPGRGSEGDDGAEVTLARAVPCRGRSRAWVDGRMATIGTLAEAAGALIELHGQHEHQALVRPDAQRRALDAFGQVDLTGYAAARRRLRRLVDESEALGGDARERARQVDLLRYQIGEIDGAGIEDAGEDERLEAEEDRLSEAAAHRQAAAAALTAVSEAEGTSALDRLAEAAAALDGRGPLTDLDGRVRSAMAELSDLASELRSVVETWEDDPERLEELRGRRQLLHQLRRKYGDSLDDVLAFADDARLRLAAAEGEEQRAQALDVEIESARAELARRGAEVAAARRKAAPPLAERIESTLHQLAMPSARFEIAVEGDGPADQVGFLLGANAGEPLMPLASSASGGELARTMLAIRLAVSDAPGVMVFDEVDAGVGGEAALAVGSALAGLASHGQVLVVTHLAQVAAQADHQIEVRKAEDSGRTRSEVTLLDGEGRVIELSRMLSGHPDSTAARRHARELLDGTPSGRGPG
jgi:DNA repair protein RecN (Recombination protein N)